MPGVPSGWQLPHWLARQTDPGSPAFVPTGHLDVPTNLTARDWTCIGTLDGAHLALVDPRGLVTPRPGGWSLDWWVGAEDRWHVPAVETAVRQELLDASPVVETRLRIPGGDAVQRAYAVRAPGGADDAALVVVEVENASPTPVAVALGVRPFDPTGHAPVREVAVDGAAILVEGQLAVHLPRPPGRVATGTGATGDSATATLAGHAVEPVEAGAGESVRCPDGMAQATVVLPLPHRATVRVAMPLDTAPSGRRRWRIRREPPTTAAASTGPVADLPDAAAVARGWASQADRGTRIVVPDRPLQDLVAAVSRHLLLRGSVAAPTGSAHDARGDTLGSAVFAAALDRAGFHDEAATVLARAGAHHGGDGHLGAGPDDVSANGAWLWAVAHHWALARRDPAVRDWAPRVALAADWIQRARRGSEPPRLPAGTPGVVAGPVDRYWGNDLWSVAGLRGAATLLAVAGEADAARTSSAAAVGLWSAVDGALGRSRELAPEASLGGAPGRPPDATLAGVLSACAPLELVPSAHPWVAAAASALRSASVHGDAVVRDTDHAGLAPGLTALLATVELRAGDRQALRRLQWLRAAAGVTGAWPAAVHPGLGGGTHGDGHDTAALAWGYLFLRDLLVRDAAGPGEVALSSLVPHEWLGRSWEVHGAPTRAGTVAYGVRWHGERPAILWEVTPHDGPVRLTAPGLDPAWSTTELRGEALLGPVAVPEPPVPPP